MLSVQADFAFLAACSCLPRLGNPLASLDPHCSLGCPAAVGNYRHEIGSALHCIFIFPWRSWEQAMSLIVEILAVIFLADVLEGNSRSCQTV